MTPEEWVAVYVMKFGNNLDYECKNSKAAIAFKREVRRSLSQQDWETFEKLRWKTREDARPIDHLARIRAKV